MSASVHHEDRPVAGGWPDMAGLSVRRPCHQVRSNCVKSVTNREIGKHLRPLCHPSGAAGNSCLLELTPRGHFLGPPPLVVPRWSAPRWLACRDDAPMCVGPLRTMPTARTALPGYARRLLRSSRSQSTDAVSRDAIAKAFTLPKRQPASGLARKHSRRRCQRAS